MGTANVFVPAGDVVFVAPSLLLHYIDSHEYQPPSEFQRAVKACPPMKSMAYLKAVKGIRATI
jgi:hypothetical protein